MMNANYENIENLLSQLLASVDKAFNRQETEEVQRFLDVGEYGLALETFTDIVLEENKKLTESDLRLINTLANAMSMKLEKFYEKFPDRAVVESKKKENS